MNDEDWRNDLARQKQRYWPETGDSSGGAHLAQGGQPQSRGGLVAGGIGGGAAVGGSHHLGLITVAAMTASHRIRSFVGWTGLVLLGMGLLWGPFALLGAVLLVLWVMATALSGIGRIVGEDLGLVEKRPVHTYKTIEPYDPIRSP